MKMGRGVYPHWKMMMEVMEKASERDHEIRELREALQQQQGKPTQRDEPETHPEKVEREEHYPEENEREREYRDIVQQQQGTIEMLMREVEKHTESVRESVEQVGEPFALSAKKIEVNPSVKRQSHGESLVSNEKSALPSSSSNWMFLLPRVSVNVKEPRDS